MMKKNLSKILCLFVVFTFVYHMFIPLTVLAIDNDPETITVAWNCDGKICAATYNGVKPSLDETTFVESSKLKDGNKVFNAAKASSYGKAPDALAQFLVFDGDRLDVKTNYASWETLVNAREDLDPAGAKDGLTFVGHNGDQAFRLIIFDEGTMFATFDIDEDKYTYFLGEWDPMMANPMNGLSSDKDKPTVYNTYLLEKFLAFTTRDNIKSVKALDVSDKGVSIAVKDKKRVEITFNSNYFSNVVFEITFENGEKRYIEVNRQFVRFANNGEVVMDAKEKNLPAIEREAYAEFIYPEGKTYENYDVYATYTVENETITEKLEPVKTKKRTIEGPFVEGMSVDAGVKLKSTRYKIKLTAKTKEVNITVTKSGATEGNVYGGTFGGNGKGVKLDISEYVYMLNHPIEGGQ